MVHVQFFFSYFIFLFLFTPGGLRIAFVDGEWEQSYHHGSCERGTVRRFFCAEYDGVIGFGEPFDRATAHLARDAVQVRVLLRTKAKGSGE